MQTFFDLRRELFRRHGRAIEQAVSLCSGRGQGTGSTGERPTILTAGIGPFAELATFIADAVVSTRQVGPDGPEPSDVILLFGGSEDEPDALQLIKHWRYLGARIICVAGRDARSILRASHVSIPVRSDDPGAIAQAAIALARYLERRSHEVQAAAAGVQVLIRFRCPACEETLLADADAAGGQAVCPFCGVVVSLPDEPGRRIGVGEEALLGREKRVSLRFALAECEVRYTRDGRDPAPEAVGCPVEDLSVTGLRFTLPEHAERLGPGDEIRLRVDIPAFLEPVVTDAEVRYVEDSSGETTGDPGDGEVDEAPPDEGILRVGVAFRDLPDSVRERLERLQEVAMGGALPLLH